MAIIHRGASLAPGKLELLTAWIGAQRWYTGKGGSPNLLRVGAFRFDDPAGEVGVEVMLVRDDAATGGVLYQVPVTYRAEPVPALSAALIGTTEHSALGTRYVYDGCHDPVFAQCLLDAIVSGGSNAALDYHLADGSTSTGVSEASATGSGSYGLETPDVDTSRVLSGEQSNTSIIVELVDDPKPLIIKLFRVLHHGSNPDVELQSALTEAGSDRIPVVVGSLRGSWPDAGGDATGHLAFAQEFLPGVQDAWREALNAALDDADFTAPARALGAATAEVHRTLADHLATADADRSTVAERVADMRARFEDAVHYAPELGQHREAFEALVSRAESVNWPELQRIHGDYHLGQVLDAGPRGWVLLDFEGEPLRPLAERNNLDSVLRDLAGMLRSFDYAGGSVEHQLGTSRRDWVAACRTAFLAGYADAAQLELTHHQAVLDAFEIDKASYEVAYEARNRPAWIDIPVTGISRLLATERSTSVPTDTPATAPVPRLEEHEAIAVLNGLHRDPHRALGGQTDESGAFVRVLRPLASTVQVQVPDGPRVDLTHEHDGLWSGRFTGAEVPDYRVVTTYDDGIEHVADDPYRFLPSLGEMDLHLIGEGRHEQLWTVLGAHNRSYDGPLGTTTGTSFAVWAPHAHGVRVIGDFNDWDGSAHSMRALGDSGVWELFIPDVAVGTRYKFEILCSDRVWRQKADPMARFTETAPANASIVTQTEYDWSDDAWMQQRSSVDPHTQPMSIYEVHPMSWRQGQSYRDLAEHLVNYVKDLGFTHVELMPVMEHPYPPSWGYHVTGYYAPNSRMGTPDDFRYLVDTLHQNGIGVILDWVPGHFATDEWALARFDGEACYEHPDPRKGWHNEWGSYVFDFGRPQVKNFLVANAVYWLQEFHADGLRVDGVASMLYLDYSRNEGEWIPNKFGGRENLDAVQLLQETCATTYRRVPGTVMMAEESTSWPGVTRSTDTGGLGFGFKWNMGWMHDSLDYISNPPVYRQYHHHQMTFALVYAWSEQFVLPISHDEVVHGKGSLLRKMPGNRWEQLANLRAFVANMWSHPGKQLLFMGCEFAQESEWADGRSLDWWLLDQPAHWGVHALVKDLNRLYVEHPALWTLDNDPSGFQWINADDAGGNTFSYIRFGTPDETGERPAVVVVANFSGAEHRDVTVGLPRGGRWREALNTDAAGYGGAGLGNLGSVVADGPAAQGQPHSATMTLPPLSVLWFIPDAKSTTVPAVEGGERHE